MAEQGAARAVLVQAAIELGLRAWRTGENIETALTAAGYARNIIEAVKNYIVDDPETADREADLTQEASQGSTMSTNKRARTDSTSSRRSTIPVAPSVKKYVKGCMKRLLETKYLDTGTGSGTCAVAGALVQVPIYSIQQGTTDSTRVGNMIHTKSITGRWSFSASDGYGNVRLILVKDNQANGAAFAIADVLRTSSVMGNYNNDNVIGHGGSRFKIILDKMIRLESNAIAAATFRDNKYIKHVFKKSVVGPVRFDGNAGTIADLSGVQYTYIVLGPVTIAYDYNIQYEYIDN